MLPESRLYSFIDQKEGFTLHFLEGQRIIQELAVIHEVVGNGFQYFRDAVLSFQPMLAFLKPGEGLGIYLDSDDPYFRLKLEMSEQGQMRTLLLPETFREFPKVITGQCRVVKTLPDEAHPYTSIIKLEHADFHNVVNQVLKQSYQINSEVFLSQQSDQSIMIMKLPAINVDKVQSNYTLSIEDYWNKLKETTDELFELGTSNQIEIQKKFEDKNLLFLGSRQINFKCTCSKERMLKGLWSIIKTGGIDHIFQPDEDSIETKCDYCKTSYLIQRAEFNN